MLPYESCVVNLGSDLELAPRIEITSEEIKTAVLMIAFRTKSSGSLLLAVEEQRDSGWEEVDKTACYEGVTLWQCMLKKPVFRARLKNPTDNPVTVTIDVNVYEKGSE